MLESVRAKLWRAKSLEAILLTLIFSASGYLGVFLSDRIWDTPNGLRALALAVAGGAPPVALGLAPGAWGVVQALTLSSSVGSLGGLACILSVEKAKIAALDLDE